MKTPEEARQCWCPHARVPDAPKGGSGITATNRHAGQKTGRDGKPRILRGNSMCIAAECMAWRWQKSEPWAVGFNEAIARGEKMMAIKLYRTGTGAMLKEAKEYVERVENGGIPRPLAIEKKSGYCGLAGRP